MEKFDLKIFTDTDCDIYIDGCFVAKLARGSIYKTTLSEGDYMVQAKTANPALAYREVFSLCRNAVLDISFETLLRGQRELITQMKLHPFIADGTGLRGFMDMKSRAVVIPAVYEHVYDFNYMGCAIVEKDKKYGMINKFGEEVIPIEYTGFRRPSPKEAPYLSNTSCVLSSEKGDGILDVCGVWKLTPDEGCKLERIHSVRSGLSFVHLYVFVNPQGEKLIFDGEKFISSESFVEVRFYEDVVVFKKQRVASQSYYYGIMDCKGRVFEIGFDYISGYQNGYAWAEKGDKEGWIDKCGDFAFMPDRTFDRYGPFDGKLALVRKGDKVGFIDKDNMEAIPFVYDAASPFTEDRAIVSKNGLIGMIDSTGREVCPCVYELFRKPNCMSFPLAVVVKDGKYGCINKDGKLLVPCMYKDLWLVEKDFIAVKNDDDLWGFVNDKNEQVVPFEFSLFKKRGCHEYSSKRLCFWETLPSWEEDAFCKCKKTLSGSVVVSKQFVSGKLSGLVNKKGLVVPCEYGITPFAATGRYGNWLLADSVDGDTLYNIFPDGTVMPVSLEVI